mgnify:CR=1 FL=1
MKLYSEENPNHPNPRCFLLWLLAEVEQIKNDYSELDSIHSRLYELEREIISFVSFMDDLFEVQTEELQQ